MWKRCLAAVLIFAPAAAFATASADHAREPFASCLRGQALALERRGFEIGAVMAQAARACRDARGDLSAEAIDEATSEVRLVVNTPTPRSGAVRDAAEIRLAATSEGILCLTAMETAVAAAEALDPDIVAALSTVRSLADRVPNPGQPRVRLPA